MIQARRSLRRMSTRLRRAAAAPRRRREAAVLVQAGVVDPTWVTRQAGLTEPKSATEAARWYLSVGWAAGASPHPLVEPTWVAESTSTQGEPVARLVANPTAEAVLAHPLLPAGRALRPLLAGLTPGTALDGGVPYETWLAQLDTAQGVLRAEQDLAGARLRSSWDTAADAAYVARWSAAPGPDGPDPWVTTVMPVRDRREPVLRAIRSVQEQTLQDWRLVVVDDGSTDSTPDAVAELAATDPRITLLRRPHEGVCAARNAGIAVVETPYVAFLDSDNTWTPDFLRTAVAAMHAAGASVAHAVVDEVGDRGHRYRAFDGQEPHLRTGNFVDLNVLVCRTDAVREIGGFDPTLRRMVDYDLVWRLAARHRLLLLPFVGVRYAASSELTDRISATESFAWDDVVKARNLVDWQALDAGLTLRDERLVSVVVPHRLPREAVLDTVGSLLRESLDGHELEVVVADNASTPGDWRLLHAQLGLDPRVRLVRSAVDLHRAASSSLALAATHGGTIVVVPSGVQLPTASLQTLVAALETPPVAAALPEGDPDAGVIAVRARTLIEARGLDPIFTDELEVADLVRRLAAIDLRTAYTSAEVIVRQPSPPPAADRHAQTLREWSRRWPGTAPGEIL